MKKLTLLILLYLIACIGYCQDSNTSLQPYFYGNLKDSTVYCFTFNQTKAIAVHVINSNYCDSVDNVRMEQIQQRELLIKESQEKLALEQEKVLNYSKIVSNNKIEADNEKIKNDSIISRLNKKVNILKVERITYPAILLSIWVALRLNP